MALIFANCHTKVAVSSHTLAECFAVLTRLPASPKITPHMAQYLIKEDVEKIATIISLTSKDYIQIIKQMTELGLSVGVIYDAIIYRTAQKCKADKILTLNERDFLRFQPIKNDFILSN